MTDAADIKDRESLEAWLQTRSQEEAVWIAMRAAARVLPIWWDEALRSDDPDVTALMALRPLLISGGRKVYESPEVGLAAIAAGYVANTAANAAHADAVAFSAHAAANAASRDPAKAAASAAYAAADAAAATAIAAATTTFRNSAYAAVAWNEVQADAQVLEQDGMGPRALWVEGDDPLKTLRQVVLSRIRKGEGAPDYHSFWVPWYEDLYAGKPSRFPPELLNAIALISHKDPDEWAKGDLHINNTVIPALMDEHMPGWRVRDTVPGNSRSNAARLDEELASLSKGTITEIVRTRNAISINRSDLPPTIEAVTGYANMEIERLQGLNYQTDAEMEMAKRQIAVLSVLTKAVLKFEVVVTHEEAFSEADAEKAEKLGRYILGLFKSWPRAKAEEFVDITCRSALVGALTSLGVLAGFPPAQSLQVIGLLVGGEKVAKAIKSGGSSGGAP